MSDTLREALEVLAERAETAEESSFAGPRGSNGEWESGFNDGKAAIGEAIRTILAAHPDDSTAEWGVQYSDSGHTLLHASRGSAEDAATTHNALDKAEWCRPFSMLVVSRSAAGPWKVSK